MFDTHHVSKVFLVFSLERDKTFQNFKILDRRYDLQYRHMAPKSTETYNMCWEYCGIPRASDSRLSGYRPGFPETHS
jgi:hypothetical protein